ncbi:CatB-related O-acetyltransferase [Clostridium peptidivorans]|uniref:CatB-related O-acetyltransferase n=1 Tax=Clostridium peptidivorans TaxID=100174 RepID=UPI000BE2A909|nr:acetyltransferase [Clostridium peptidivorans]
MSITSIEISDNTIFEDNSVGSNFKAFRNAVIKNCFCGDNVSIGDDTTVVSCKFGDNIAINRRNYINNSEIGNFTYTGINTTINFSTIGKFCSIARNVDIGGFDHDYSKITTMPLFRFSQILAGGGNLVMQPKHEELCRIGNDVWIAAGAHILHKVTIGDGAIIGAGAVVTRDVEPYAIVAGVPARTIKYRFSEKHIEILQRIKWWDWPKDVIIENSEFLIHSEINDKTIEKLCQIAESINKER